jgi:hypothetical protein
MRYSQIVEISVLKSSQDKLLVFPSNFVSPCRNTISLGAQEQEQVIRHGTRPDKQHRSRQLEGKR